MKVIYMAHPYGAPTQEERDANLANAKKWVRWIEMEHPNVAVVASWTTECEIWDDTDLNQRAASMGRNCAVISRCDELWLVGGRLTAGMQVEKVHAEQTGEVGSPLGEIPVRDLLHLGFSPPSIG